MKTWHLVFGLSAIFLIGVAVVYIFGFRSNQPRVSQVDLEITKSALSGSIVAVIGAVIALLIKAREQNVQMARLRADLLSQFLRQLGELYRSVKATRRRLRSEGLSSRFENSLTEMDENMMSVYAKEMSSLDQAQLALEDLKIQAKNLPPLAEVHGVAEGLRDMEDYLRVVLRESEQARARVHSGCKMSFPELVRLREFTGSSGAKSPVPDGHKTSNYRFSSHFADAYEHILTDIRPNLKGFPG